MIKKEDSICESCGNVGEIGFIIAKGDEVANVTITGTNYNDMKLVLNEYIKVAQRVNANVSFEEFYDEENSSITANIFFDVTAEKIIFELNTRNLNK